MSKYWYLAGPMSNIPQYNFPKFTRVADELRGYGYNIVSPHELDDNLYWHEAWASEDGGEPHMSSQSEKGLGFLRRDVELVTHPDCIGVIAMEGWDKSFGAQIEVFLADRFKKQTLLYIDGELIQFNYNDAMREANCALHQ